MEILGIIFLIVLIFGAIKICFEIIKGLISFLIFLVIVLALVGQCNTKTYANNPAFLKIELKRVNILEKPITSIEIIKKTNLFLGKKIGKSLKIKSNKKKLNTQISLSAKFSKTYSPTLVYNLDDYRKFIGIMSNGILVKELLPFNNNKNTFSMETTIDQLHIVEFKGQQLIAFRARDKDYISYNYWDEANSQHYILYRKVTRNAPILTNLFPKDRPLLMNHMINNPKFKNSLNSWDYSNIIYAVRHGERKKQSNRLTNKKLAISYDPIAKEYSVSILVQKNGVYKELHKLPSKFNDNTSIRNIKVMIGKCFKKKSNPRSCYNPPANLNADNHPLSLIFFQAEEYEKYTVNYYWHFSKNELYYQVRKWGDNIDSSSNRKDYDKAMFSKNWYSKNQIAKFVQSRSFYGEDDYPTQYNPESAVQYALDNYDKKYSGGQNEFPDFENRTLGGNCTNFASQVLVAGLSGFKKVSEVFQHRLRFDTDRIYKGQKICQNNNRAWFISNERVRGDAWSGAQNLREYATYNGSCGRGVFFEEITVNTDEYLSYELIKLGDLIFFQPKNKKNIYHTMVVTQIDSKKNKSNRIKVTYQSNNKVNRVFSDILKNPFYQKGKFFVYRPLFYFPH